MSPRIEPLTAETLDDEALAALKVGFPRAADTFLSGAPDAPPFPTVLGLLLNHPKLAAPWFTYNNVLLHDPSITARQRELAILRVAWRARGTYEWLQHVRLGQHAGITNAEIEAITVGADAGSWEPLEADVLRATDELFDDARITDETWKRLSEHFDTRQLMELTFVVGSYLTLAFVFNSADLALDKGLDPGNIPVPRRDASASERPEMED
jgi:4-carboxymuconolactone decarboxylase